MHTARAHGDAVNAERERERERERENNVVKNRLARVRIATDHERRALPAARHEQLEIKSSSVLARHARRVCDGVNKLL